MFSSSISSFASLLAFFSLSRLANLSARTLLFCLIFSSAFVKTDFNSSLLAFAIASIAVLVSASASFAPENLSPITGISSIAPIIFSTIGKTFSVTKSSNEKKPAFIPFITVKNAVSKPTPKFFAPYSM